MFVGICYAFFYSFSYRDKIIIKIVSNIIGTGYSIAWLYLYRERERERESAVGIMDATGFRGIRDLIPFHVLFKLFQFFSKYRS